MTFSPDKSPKGNISTERERERREKLVSRSIFHHFVPKKKIQKSDEHRIDPFPDRRCLADVSNEKTTRDNPPLRSVWNSRRIFRSERIFVRLEKFVERGKRVEETFRGDERKPQSDIFPLGTAACPRLNCLEGICYGHLLPTKRREGTRVPRGPLFATTKHI